MMRGHVDGMAGGCVIGWALAEPDHGPCEVLITDERGQTLAAGAADLARADLASLGAGRTDLAFRVPLRLGAKRGKVHVLADGIELAGSPLGIGPGNFDYEAEVSAGQVVGWITERVEDAGTPLIRVVNQHGEVVGDGKAAADPASPADDPDFGRRHFAIDLQDRCFGCGELRLRLFANGARFAELTCHLELAGNLDLITDETYVGWLMSPAAPKRALSFEIFQDGVRAGKARCGIARADVRALFPAALAPGFDVTLRKAGHTATDATAVSFRFAGSDLDLFNGPYVVASRTAAVLTAQRAAQSSYRGFEGLGVAERAVVQVALHDFMTAQRKATGFSANRQQSWPVRMRAGAPRPGPRLTIVVPIYKGVEETKACIRSVLAHRNPASDHVVLINDASPEPEMAAVLEQCAGAANLFVLTNEENLGFVKSANRGIGFALGGDVLLLNADAVLFAGGLDEMCRVAATPGVGTVTAMSNNATVFSYPHPEAGEERLDALPDVSWAELAKVALKDNAGVAIDVPTGHGFCLLIKGEVLRRIGALDEVFGLGYGEENDFCTRAAGWGYRNVAAAGAFVVHKEGVSFGETRRALVAENTPRLEQAYPEFHPAIYTFIERDGLRRGRWALDKARLAKAAAAGTAFVLLVSNTLVGGTVKAIADIEAAQEDADAVRLKLRAREDGMVELVCPAPDLRAVFAASEVEPVFEMLAAAAPKRVMVHQLLGFGGSFIARMGEWVAGRRAVYVAHDFYPLCPRVTMIDAAAAFCDVAPPETCARCVALGGAHPSSRLAELTPAAHRALFAKALAAFDEVIAPSENAAGYLRRVFTGLSVRVQAHPEPAGEAPPRTGDDEIVLLGAVGVDKGSAKLLEIAKRAVLSHPRLKFRVIGHTDMDAALEAVGNVTITGRYKPEELAGQVREAAGRIALFLHGWPETYSYTLSEALRWGFLPVVPDIGAPADRVRAGGRGVIYPLAATAGEILLVIDQVREDGRRSSTAEVSEQPTDRLSI